MSRDNNIHYAALIKDQYLPPSLENTYLSLFDIQVKMAKEFLDGTEQEKISTIKKRIKKFFDYGNEKPQNDEITFVNQKNKRVEYPRFQGDLSTINQNLEIDCSKIIVFSKEKIKTEDAQKIFPGYVDITKIDDCNIQLSFVKKQKCQVLLYRNAKDKSTMVSEHILYPTNIQWFELQNNDEENNLTESKYCARYATNKDDILFQNDIYFRRLLGKVRKTFQVKQLENQEREKDFQEMVQKKRVRALQKTKFISKGYNEKNYHNKDFDAVTNYDGYYQPQSFQTSRDFKLSARQFEKKPFYHRQNYHRKINQRSNKYFDDLNVSQIGPVPIQLEGHHKEKSFDSRRQFSGSKDLFEFPKKGQVRRQNSKSKECFGKSREGSTRDELIRQYRNRQSSPRLRNKRKNLDSYDFDTEYTKRVQRDVSRGQKLRYQID